MTAAPPVSRKKFFRRRIVRAGIAVIAGIVPMYGGWEAALRIVPAPAIPNYPRPATFIEDRSGQTLAAFVGQEDAWSIPLKSEEISPNLKKAIIAVEDRRFYDHHGVDWRSAIGAAWQDLSSFHIRRGASTITMQVVHLRDARPRSFLNKFEQAFRAEQIELAEDKDAILTEYINRAPFGGNIVGAGAASWCYFDKSCADLSLGQAALLAGLPQSPNHFRPDIAPYSARQRRTHVLQQMLDMHAITQEEFTRANSEPIAIQPRTLPQEINPNGAAPTLIRLAEEHPGGHLRATLDSAIQKTTFDAATADFRTLQQTGIDSGCILVIDVPTAEIRAAVSLNSPDLDLTTRPRSTGSILKPFIYAAAFDAGILTPNTPLLDSPKAWAGYVPANFDRDFHGKMPAADALAQSRNIPAMLVLSKLTVDSALTTLDNFGIHTPSRASRNYGLSLAIGGAEATPLEIAEAYTTLASGGLHQPLRFIIENQKSKIENSSTRILPASICYQTLTCISDPQRTDTIENAHDAAQRGIAWKTGTSNGFRDAWCAAASARTVVVVWFGNRESRGNSALVGQDAAAPLALHLIAMLDKDAPLQQPWPATFPAPTTAPAELALNNQLSITSPAPNIEILTESDQPPRIALQSAGGSGAKRWWFADDQLITTATQNTPQLFWSPAPGRHTLRVVDESGAAATIKLQVR